ncbi:MAG: hypothetical protein WC302_03370 [Candidatus Paceibacterota bacterium]|jgi:hypothetical protein
MGKGKSICLYDWLIAANATCGTMEESYCELPTGQEGFELKILPSPRNQEKELIKQEMLSSLSTEAKEVIDIVLNSPAEVIESLTTPTYNCISKSLISKYLKHKNWKKNKIESSFNEIKLFVTGLEELG